MKRINMKNLSMLLLFIVTSAISLFGAVIYLKGLITREMSSAEFYVCATFALTFNLTVVSYQYLKEQCK